MVLGVNCTSYLLPKHIHKYIHQYFTINTFTLISSSYALPYNISARDMVLRNTSYTKFTASDFTAVCFY